MSLEDSFCNYARSTGQNSVVLCDRGVMDGQAYVTDDVWRTVLQVSVYSEFFSHLFFVHGCVMWLICAIESESVIVQIWRNLLTFDKNQKKTHV